MNKEHYFDIISAKGHLSIQDLGRPQSQHLGFSVGGCADEHAYLYANRLIHNLCFPQQQRCNINALNQPTLEITFGQVSLRANHSCIIAISGADCAATINQEIIANWQAHTLHQGDVITFAMPKAGLHNYMAVAGGLYTTQSPRPWLASYAQTINELPLGFSGTKLQQGNKLYFFKNASKTAAPRQQNKYMASFKADNFYADNHLTLRFIPSQLFEQLTKSSQETFLNRDYIVSKNSNRMGYRLEPSSPNQEVHTNILPKTLRTQHALSAPVSYGMIQLPQNDHPIILMKERQTIGGYPVMGNVMQTDLFRLSQLRAGASICFVPITIAQAQNQLRAFYLRFQEDYILS